MNNPLSCFGSNAAYHLLNSRVEHKTNPTQFREGAWSHKIITCSITMSLQAKAKDYLMCLETKTPYKQPGKKTY